MRNYDVGQRLYVIFMLFYNAKCRSGMDLSLARRCRFSWLAMHCYLLLQDSRFPVINPYFIAESQFMEGP